MLTALLCTVGLPTVLQALIMGSLSLAFGLSRKPHFDGPIMAVWWRPWFDRLWPFATTIPFLGKPSWWNERVRFHEWEHVMFYLFLNFLGLALAGVAILLGVQWWLALAVIWGSSGVLWVLPTFLMAGLLHWRPGVTFMQAVYLASIHEQWAYSVTKAYYDGLRDPWEHHRDKARNLG